MMSVHPLRIKHMKRPASIGAVALLLVSVALAVPALLNAAPETQTSTTGLTAKVAPGEILPLSVKLLNFGSSNRVDVAVSYTVTDSKGAIIYSAHETVAVETTASFVKKIPIPLGTIPGHYIAKSFILYPDQLTPATSEFPFMVERKYFGVFQSDWYLYGGILVVVIILAAVISRLLIRRRRVSRMVTQEYAEIPHDMRIFYEMLSDTIIQMRQRVGDQALEIASHIEGLTLDRKSGRVLALSGRPSKIIADLVTKYELILGKKVSFSLRKDELTT